MKKCPYTYAYVMNKSDIYVHSLQPVTGDDVDKYRISPLDDSYKSLKCLASSGCYQRQGKYDMPVLHPCVNYE